MASIILETQRTQIADIDYDLQVLKAEIEQLRAVLATEREKNV